MTGMVSSKELNAALEINSDLKDKITKYERDNWAANITSPQMQLSWRTFMAKLEKAINQNKLNDSMLIDLIQYLSTQDSIHLMEQIGKLNQDRQVRFLELLNWVSEKSQSVEQRQNASSVKERVLMIYRMKEFPRIYSPARIARATNIIKSS